ncbi:FliO/MopB family protein [Sphingomonas sp. R1]|uniref:FliO/MopB family protein n=1 Tax=Sphingomonas sp. R1 TaxID=399176 RepID=UPI0022257033|nr:flagellar biosynthetic protein FliO [Sphingomonas sp. R1]UYY77446.1 flagellar biosynthetic protein FliO [Sphingomonas sp. R1]
MLRTLGALGLVLGMLATALWVVRRYDLKLPGRVTGGGRKRVELVERLAVDAKRSVALIRRDGCEHLILIGPEGHATIETGITPPAPVPVAEAPAEPDAPAKIEDDLAVLKAGVAKLAGKLDFKGMVDKLRPDTPTDTPAEAVHVAPEMPFDASPAEEAPAEAPVVIADPAPTLPQAANDAEPAPLEEGAKPAPRSRARKAPTRTRIARDTTRWNKRAVREALNA